MAMLRAHSMHLELTLGACANIPSRVVATIGTCGRAEIGEKKDDTDEGALLEAEATGDGRGLALGSSKENCHPLTARPLSTAQVTWV